MTASFARRCIALALIVVGLVGCDQATKVYAVRNLKPIQNGPPLTYLGDLIRIRYAENEGAFLGLGGQLQSGARFWVITVAPAIVLLWAAAFALSSRKMDKWVFVGLALIVAGGVGNMIDRVRLGVVIDFLNLGIGNHPLSRTGVFNVADVAITGGFLLLLPFLLRGEAKEEAATEMPANS
jgi:signal peptidase II